MPNCTIFQKFSRVNTIFTSLKYNILTSHIHISKLCQDRLYSVDCSVSKMISADQSANNQYFFIKITIFIFKISAICTQMNQITLCLQNFLEWAYSLRKSTTKIILIISSSTKMLFLEDIGLPLKFLLKFLAR